MNVGAFRKEQGVYLKYHRENLKSVWHQVIGRTDPALIPHEGGPRWAAPILSVYPGLDADMLPLALVVVILGGLGSLAGAFLGSFVIGFIYTFGQVLFPDLAYMILFLPMVVILAARPRGLFGRITA